MTCPNCGKPLQWVDIGVYDCGTPACQRPQWQKFNVKGKIVYRRMAEKILERPTANLLIGLGEEENEQISIRPQESHFICVRHLLQGVEKSHSGVVYHLKHFFKGVLYGDFITDAESASESAGQLVGGFIPVAAIRDVIANGYNLYTGEVGWGRGLFQMGLSVVMLIPLVGGLVKWAGRPKQVAHVVEVAHLAKDTRYERLIGELGVQGTSRTQTFGAEVQKLAEDAMAKRGETFISEQARGQLPKVVELYDDELAKLATQVTGGVGSPTWNKIMRPDGTVNTSELLRTITNLKGPAHELSWLESRLRDPNVRQITDFSNKMYRDAAGAVFAKGAKGRTPWLDIDIGCIRRDPASGILFHEVDSLKAWKKVGGSELEDGKKVLGHMLEFATASTSREPLRLRLLVEGEAEIAAAEGKGLAALDERVAAINAQLQARFEASKTPWRTVLKEDLGAMMEEQVPLAVKTGLLKKLVASKDSALLPPALPYPTDAICSACGDRMVDLSAIFPCVTETGAHTWVEQGKEADAISKAGGAEASVSKCSTCGKYGVRHIVADSADYEHDKVTMKALKKAWHLLNLTTAPHDGNVTVKDGLACSICGWVQGQSIKWVDVASVTAEVRTK